MSYPDCSGWLIDSLDEIIIWNNDISSYSLVYREILPSSVQFPYNPVVGYFHETAYDNDHLIGWYFHTHSSNSFYAVSVSYYCAEKPTEGCRVHFRCVDYCFDNHQRR